MRRDLKGREKGRWGFCGNEWRLVRFSRLSKARCREAVGCAGVRWLHHRL